VGGGYSASARQSQNDASINTPASSRAGGALPAAQATTHVRESALSSPLEVQPHSVPTWTSRSDPEFQVHVQEVPSPKPLSSISELFTTKSGRISLLLILLVLAGGAVDWKLWDGLASVSHSSKTHRTFAFVMLQFCVLIQYFIVLLADVCCRSRRRVDDQAMRAALPFGSCAKIAAFDVASMFLSWMAAPLTVGGVVPLLHQSSLLCIMVFSYFILSARYSRYHILSALIIAAGAVPRIAELTREKWTPSEYDDFVWGTCIYALSLVPFALSSVFREKLFRTTQNVRIDPTYFMRANLALQFLFSWILIPLLMIPVFGDVSIAEFPRYLYDGMGCMVGRRFNDVKCTISGTPLLLILLYAAVNLLVLALRGVLIQRVSISILHLVTILTIVAAQVLLLLHRGAFGRYTVDFTTYDGLGLLLIILGVAGFRLSQAHARQSEDEASYLLGSGDPSDAILDRLSGASNHIYFEEEAIHLNAATGFARHVGGYARMLQRKSEPL